MTVLEKQPSPELLSLIKAAAQSLLGFGELWSSIKKKGIDEGFSERELQDLLRPLLRDKLNANQMRYLFHREEEIKRSQENRQNAAYVSTKIPANDAKNVLDEAPEYDEQIKELGIDKINEVPVVEAEDFGKEEDPDKIEIQFLKERVQQLEEALHKTSQFVPATQLTTQEIESIKNSMPAGPIKIQTPEEYDKEVFEWLAKRHNGTTYFWFPNYGRELFKNRIISQLENSGVRTFKRLYFEV